MTAPVPLLSITDLSRTYSSGSGEVSVLAGVSLKLEAGDSLAIVGPSGSGKSTLLQIIGTLDRANSGSITLDGRDLGALNEQELAAVRNTKIGFVFQSHYLLPQCTAWENVLVPTLAAPQRAAGVSPADQTSPTRNEAPEQRAERLLKRVGLGERTHHFPGQLSGGERQRVAVVRALINQPKLLLADEPTGALDQTSADSLGQLLVELNQEEGVTLIIVTHSMELAKRMKRVMRLEEGKLVEAGD